jgi:lipoyl-dependent peroxiredoxin subunit D
MTINTIKQQLHSWAKDTKLNLGSVLSEEGAPELSLAQIHGIALACAYNTGNRQLIHAMQTEAKTTLSTQAMQAAKSACTVMAMNNVYYRFVHLMPDGAFAQMPANLRMSVIGNPGIDKVDFELYSLAISAINGCGMCMEAHVGTVNKTGISKTGVQSCVRIASVIQATACALAINDSDNL